MDFGKGGIRRMHDKSRDGEKKVKKGDDKKKTAAEVATKMTITATTVNSNRPV